MPRRDNIARREVQAPTFALIAAPGTGSARIAWLAERAFGVANGHAAMSAFPGNADEANGAFPAAPDTAASRRLEDSVTVIAFADPQRSCEYIAQRQGLPWREAELRWIECYAEALRAVPADRRFLLPMDRVDAGDWQRMAALHGRLWGRADDEGLEALRGYYLSLVRKFDRAPFADVLASSRLGAEIRLAWMLLHQDAESPKPSPELAPRLSAIVERLRDRTAREVQRERETADAATRAARELVSLHAAAVARIDELDRLKQSRWWRLRLGFRPQRDLSQDIPAAYVQLTDDGLLLGLRPEGTRLAIGRNLAPQSYEEYALRSAIDLTAEGILIALCADLPGTTFIAGVELVAPSATIAGHFVSPTLRTEDLAQPVRFSTGSLKIKAGERWRLRVFVRDATGPVRAYEFQRRSLLRRWRTQRFAFVGVDLA